MRALPPLVLGVLASWWLATAAESSTTILAALWPLPAAFAIGSLALPADPRLRGVIPAGLLALALATLQPSWGLPHSDRIVAGLVGAIGLAAVAVRGYRLLKAPGPRRASGWGLLVALTYVVATPWAVDQRDPDGDEPWFLLVTHSLAADADVDLANNYAGADSLNFMNRELEPQPGDPTGRLGQQYSRHSSLLSAFLVPAYSLGGRTGAVMLVALVAGLLAFGFVRVCKQLGFDDSAVPIPALLLALAPPVSLYALQIWTEIPAAALALLAYSRIKALESGAPQRGANIATLVVAIGLLPLLKIRYGLVALGLVLVALFSLRRLRPAYRLALAAAALPMTWLLVFNEQRFGRWLRMHELSELRPSTEILEGAQRLLGLFFDLSFGLVPVSPLWLLLVPAVWVAWRQQRRVVIDVALLCLPTLLLIATRREWYGGWSPPFRYAMVVLPFLALLLVPLFHLPEGRSPWRSIATGLLGVSLGLTVVLWVQPGWSYNLADGRHHLVQVIEGRYGFDVARFLPSATRPRAALWLWPLASAIGLVALARLQSRRILPSHLTAFALLLGTSLPLLAQSLPTRRLDPEASYVSKTGGHPEPERWVSDRLRFSESWVLREGEKLEARVRAGGTRLTAVLHARLVQNREAPFTVRLSAGGHLLGEASFDQPEQWLDTSIGPVDWPREAQRVELQVLWSEGGTGPINGLVIDSIGLNWSSD